MSFQERSFMGKSMRPAPEVHVEGDGSFGVVVTPWGPRTSTKKIVDTLNDFINSAKDDTEVTSPFQKLTCLSKSGNTLRAAIMLTNDIVYREENKNEYLAGSELFAFSSQPDEFSFIQIGQPHVLLARKGFAPQIIGHAMTSSLEFSNKSKLPPMPQELLGLHSTSNFKVVTFRPMPGDTLILISRTRLPAAILSENYNPADLEEITNILSADDSEEPFWAGVYEIPSIGSSASEDEAA